MEFNPGFRFSTLDFFVLLIGFMIGGDVGAVMFWPGMAMLFALGNFFLFCNVVRMERASELVWAAVFLSLSGATILGSYPSWPVTLTLSLAATVVLIAIEIRKPSYHGVFWKQVNPELPLWWEADSQRV